MSQLLQPVLQEFLEKRLYIIEALHSVFRFSANICVLIFWPSFLLLLPPRAAGVVEGDLAAIEAYKSSGGDIARQLTADEVQLLNRSSAFDVGFTLVHLAIRFQRQDMLAILLTEVGVLTLFCLSAPPQIETKAAPSFWVYLTGRPKQATDFLNMHHVLC